MRSLISDRLTEVSHFPCRYQVQYDEGFDNILVVDGVPVIDKSKLEKLLQKISKDFSRKGCPIKPENISMPWNESNGKSKGCVSLVFILFAVIGSHEAIQVYLYGIQERR